MKINKLIVLSLILLILFTLSAVSAEKNITNFTSNGDLLTSDSPNANFNDLNKDINESTNELLVYLIHETYK